MDLINNTSKTLRDDLSVEIKQGSKMSIAAACFSIYAFEELKKELKGIDELRFIFTSPTFTTEKTKKEKREFYIPRLNRERSLYGTEFEVKLRNELTQKAIAKECADWIRQKVTFKSNITTDNMMGFINLDDKNYMPVNGFTTVDLGCERGNNAYNMVHKTKAPSSEPYLELFDNLWNDGSKLQEVTEEVIENITTAYNENSPDFIYFVTLYNIFNEFLSDISEDVLPNEATGFKDSKIWNMLYNFQKDAALAIINKLEKYNGCILADSVGLGKTFTALSVIKYYENRNKSVLVLCPKKLSNNWNTYKDNYVNNPIAEDRLRYDVLYHTDLNRTHGKSNGLDLERLNWGNYDLIVIDESHNFRNGGRLSGEDNDKENRYFKLLNKVIRKGVKTKVLMLSATPVNNRFNDLKNQLALAYEGNTDYIDEKLNTTRSIDDIFKNAQKAFNTWSKWETCDRTTDNLLRMLDFDFFEILDSVTIARSRKHIQKYYDTSDIGTFPTRLKPISLRPKLTDLKTAITYNEIFEQLMLLNLSIYTPTHFILSSRMEKYAEMYEDNKVNIGFTQANREQGIRSLMATNLMKRMESSVFSFNLTLKRIKELIESTISTIDTYDKNSTATLELRDISNIDEFDDEDQNSDDLFSFGNKVKIELADMDYRSWKDSLQKDCDIFELLTLMISDDLYHISQEMEQYKGFTISDINPIHGTVTFTNGEVICAGEVVGDVSEKDMRRIQIKETILSHFEKEEKLFNMGIKSLTLFFIDEVSKYRQYDDNGDEVLGEYGEIFEREYISVLNENINLFDTPYQKYLKSTCSDVSAIHKGYFSIDKKTGRSIDSQTKRGSEFSDDISAYDLILKNKEQLLSFDEPTRFIFSHSALREGWDNPNVFQICTLKHSDSQTAKRQEVGRGLRLCVNQDGNRIDVENCGDAVHDINILTVIASESYKNFVSDLQSDIKTVLYDRPTIATSEYFKGKYIIVDGTPTLIDNAVADAIEFYLISNGYVDMKRKITDKYRADVAMNTVASLPNELQPMADGIYMLIQAVYDDSVLEGMFSDGHETKVKENPLNDNFAKAEFQALWKQINHKYAYTVEFDSNELIRKAIAHINEKLFVTQLQYTTTIGHQKKEMNVYEVEQGDSFMRESASTYTLKHTESNQIKYDLIGKISEGTVLTRKTVGTILQGMRIDKLDMFRNNPEEFISKVIKLIKEQKATMIVEHISYNQLEGEYDSTIFTAEKSFQSIDKAFRANKAIQDYVFTDGSAEQSIEKRFVQDLDTATEVCVYAKLPKGFHIPTPVGNYSPDWAMAFYEGIVKHIFFIAETKGTMDSLNLRLVEQAKISCAKKLFNEISTSKVRYHDVDNYQSLLNIMNTL